MFEKKYVVVDLFRGIGLIIGAFSYGILFYSKLRMKINDRKVVTINLTKAEIAYNSSGSD